MQVDGRRLARWQLVLLVVWLGPGALVSWLLRDSVPWVSIMSWYAIVCAHAAGWMSARAERAVESSG